jgi:ESCRT-II complex subunit VPS36
VRVIQQAAFDDDAVARRLADAARNAAAGIGGLEASELLRVSVTLALEYLIVSETKGLLCRDDAIQGLRFFPNRFLEWECPGGGLLSSRR